MEKVLFSPGSDIVRSTNQKVIGRYHAFIKAFVVMKLIVLFIIAACLQVSAKSYAQSINLSLKNVKLEKAFREIEKQSSYHFIYTTEQLDDANPVTIEVKNALVESVLAICFKEQPVTYTVSDKYIIVKKKENSKRINEVVLPIIELRGRVMNEDGDVVPGATVSVKGSTVATACNNKGEWRLSYEGSNPTLIISSVGYESKEVTTDGRNFIEMILKRSVSSLDETIMIAYGNTTQRLNTGSVGKISSAEINKQPVSNMLAALEGRVPGLIVNQTTGVTGGKFKVEIRGRNSIAQGSEPLIIIDGVPFAANNNNINQLSSALSSFAGQGLSPLNGFSPLDIESVEVLKDADATAIYGSRGANGVILITTKKGKSGKSRVNVNLYSGVSKVTRTMDMLNTAEYVKVRREAFANDQVIPDATNAPDLFLWDSTRYTDLKKLLIGGKAFVSDAQVSLSGGNEEVQYLFGGDYHYESSIFSNDLSDKRSSFHFNLHSGSGRQKFSSNLIINYSYDKNLLAPTDLTSYLTAPPNIPSLYTNDGKLNWEEKGYSFQNPLAELMRKYVAKTDNLLGNLQLNYKLMPGLALRMNAGYNLIWVDEQNLIPKASQNPQTILTGTANFANNRFNSWTLEPQAEYKKNIGKGKLELLAGASWQEIVNKRSSVSATGYTNDALLGSVNGASSLKPTDGYTQYRYAAVFGRINYNWKDKYILNLTGRRDGSSRFGPNKQFANFGAAGVAWIFSDENFIKKKVSFISYGKLRASYGKTGNDQIGDYQYLDSWSPVNNRYQGATVLPNRLFNADYSWEINKKVEASIELGFLKDKILFTGTYFRNKSGNQLVNYRLPGQTGFQSIIRNFPAVVQNRGWEFSLSTKNISGTHMTWSSSLNLTLPQNKLVSFPGLKTSSYATNYVEGKSLNVVYGYHLSGVDPVKGIYLFDDIDKNGSIGLADYVASFDLDPDLYGGVNNIIRYNNWELSLFVEFRKQKGFNYNNYPINNFTPGMNYNLPLIMLRRWQRPGNNSSIQQFTQTYTPAFDAQYNFTLSDGRFGDASYVRMKNLSLSFSLPASASKKIHADACRFYLLGQNLFTITGYEGSDPEIQNLFVLPPLKTFTAGLQITF